MNTKGAGSQAAASGLNKAAILAIILVSYVMIVLDTSIVLTGLPRIHQGLGFTDAGLAWVQSAYTLTFGGFLLLGARAGDILGRRRMLMVGLALFTFASLAIGAAQSVAWMIGTRAVQGFGAAILAPSTLALLQTTFDEGPERTRAVSYYSAVAGIAASVGLVLGGLLADWISWRVGFLINLPIGIAMIVAARRYIAETEQSAGQLDIIGALTSTVGMAALVYGFIRSADSGWADSVTQASLTGAAVLLGIFILNEWKAKQPIMPLRLFASRERAGAYAARILFLGAMIGFFFFTTQYLQGVLAYGASLTGMAFLPMTMMNFTVAMVVPQLTRRLSNGRVLAGGLALALFGMAWLSRASFGTDYWTGVALPMMLIGAGQGMTLSPLTTSGIAGVASEDAGAGSGVVNVAHQLGNSLGLAVLVAVAVIGAGPLGGRDLLAYRFGAALAAGSAMLALALLIVLVLIARPRGAAQAVANSASA
ncbi:MFS transporter [Mesorhizobium sp. M1C.F.Ca.ET.193.01.1.1]|uniref:MFS transporter n=1 Tax=unclassified Mesorhizobium TaxID=325217 RepID=UPI000FD24AD6|nr:MULTISPECIES: MFS transporter [unclassified Mesorhizobium]TGS96467.1 MFS transporter [bacterium M00.F.Ca.ET.177.01.1.1]TGQ52197.1 MFS transporter [Mesorhizobium sp. M1C.F.Ca.ET.210.01.1.1]TGQ68836.1 MFS transporter [Mesorhizobium sp. M1C.F.Ca.ET.212.01.1.1]TGR04187.1 MFS transporter [Mesorhizobium sp. M1C.F.Ca.ET.204.01.1.1]TGR24852.1 MFS transporter [Mesorhizobium sp. M1C.F.Ca.ET.196.01.1.1]